MSTLRRILKNTGVVFLGGNSLKVISVILTIFIARYLGDVDYGSFSFVISFTGLFFILMDLGTRILITREIAQKKKKAPKIVSNIFILKLFTSVIVYGIILLVAFLLKYNMNLITAIAVAALGIIFDSFATTLGSIYQAYERMEFPTSLKLIRVIVRFAITLPLLLAGYGFMPVLIVFVFVRFLNFLVSLLLCYKYFVQPIFDYDREYIWSLVKRSFPFLLSGIFVTVYFRIDITLMSKLAPTILKGFYSSAQREAIIGWYSAAYNILDGLISIAGAVSVATLPVAIVYFKESKKKLLQLYTFSVKYLTYLSIPVAFGITLLARKIILLIYGIEYLNSVLPLQILVWTVIPLFINYILGVINIATHQEKEGVYILFATSLVNVVLNFILIPKFSLYGAAFATIISEIFYFAGYYHITNKVLKNINVFKYMIKPLISSVIMAFVIMQFLQTSIFILIPIGAFVYGVSMLFLRAFNKEDFDMVRKILKN